uniref:SOCS box domain-containing protein n=1 Tax=Trichogramma kaykai TaxID=54128 RepID=A0ABD2XK22_9HYME
MAENDQSCLRKLTLVREQANWEIEAERRQLFHEVLSLVTNWTGRLPNLRDIFRTEEIDFLLSCAADPDDEELEEESEEFIEFVISAGYKDEPDLDEEGKPLLRRNTPINQNITQSSYSASVFFRKLFQIYDRFDVNYVGEDGYTHFHAACELNLVEIVEKFLELGQDPNCQSYCLPPLHLATLARSQVRRDLIGMLLRNGANPNMAGKDGMTPLHVIWQNNCCRLLSLETFLISCKDVGRAVQVDARDHLGRTPLQCAVAYVSPYCVDLLLDNGADLSQFTFPTVSHCEENLHYHENVIPWDGISLVIGGLEKRGYKLDENAYLTIRALFIKYKLLSYASSTSLHQSLRDEEFVRDTKKLMWNSSLSFYDLIQLSPKEAAKVFTFTDYVRFTDSEEYFRQRTGLFCDEHLCAIVSRRFIPSRWAVYPFWDLIHYRLPIECCEMILEHLSSQDLVNIMVATGNQDW